jgi:hypothetical protein
MMAATIQATPTLAAGKPRLLFEQHFEKSIFPFEANYDVSPDGRRLLLVVPGEGESAPAQINVVLNWSEELRTLVRADR